MKKAYVVYASLRNSVPAHVFIDSYLEKEEDAKEACRFKTELRSNKYLFYYCAMLVDESVEFDTLDTVREDDGATLLSANK